MSATADLPRLQRIPGESLADKLHVTGIDMDSFIDALHPDDRARIAQLWQPTVASHAVKSSPARFAVDVLGYDNAPVHDEWYGLLGEHARLAIVAPRDHGKSECLTVVHAAWRIVNTPGVWVYVFAATTDLAKALKARIDEVVRIVRADLVPRGAGKNSLETLYSNGARVTARGAGAAVRGAHPDIIIGDDVLEESRCLTAYQRDKTARWWHGTVGGMAHSGTIRNTPEGRRKMPGSRVLLVGTPFHRSDLLMSMRENALYHFRRYAAEYDPASRPSARSLAVEIA